MTRAIAAFLLGVLLTLLADFLLDLRMEPAPPAPASASLEDSLDHLAQSISEAGTFVRAHSAASSPRAEAEGYRHILRLLIASLEGKALMDPDFPYFREINTRTKSGMDNPDQRYLIATLDGDAAYRVWGTRGTSRRLDITLYGEDDLSPSISTLDTEALEVKADGGFEVWIGGEERPSNWLASRSGVVRLLVRQIHSDWPNEGPGDIHIDRIDAGRPRVPEFGPAILAARLDAAREKFAVSVRRWPEYSRTRLQKLLPANRLSPPRDTGETGGLAGRLLVAGHFDLEEDEALIITTWPSGAAYQGIQLGHHWFASLDYANRQSSLTTDQAAQSSDGAYRFVISARDPGYANWLDPGGFTQGTLMLRYDGLTDPDLPSEQHPVARLVQFTELADALPADDRRVTPEERAAAIARRRQHVQRRFGN